MHVNVEGKRVPRLAKHAQSLVAEPREPVGLGDLAKAVHLAAQQNLQAMESERLLVVLAAPQQIPNGLAVDGSLPRRPSIDSLLQ